MKRIYLLVNGIDTFPGSAKNWNGRGVTWLHTHAGHYGEKIEYFCGPIDRAFGQKDRADKFTRTAAFYEPDRWARYAVGHSNGAAVILTGLKLALWPRFEELHLVCGACEPDFNRNGLNAALVQGRVGKVFVYVSGKDEALRAAATWFGQFLGYGDLGLHGPVNVAQEIADRVTVVTADPWTGYGHGDCWHDANFERTMRQLIT